MRRTLERRVGRGVVLAAMALGGTLAQAQMAVPVKVQQARMQRVSVEQYRAHVEALRGLAARCGADAGTCDAKAVGDDDRVTVGAAEFEARWQWMRDALDAAGKAKSTGEREQAMAAAAARLDEVRREEHAALAGAPFGAARKVTDAVLSRPEFRTVEQASWLDRKMARFWLWWYRLWNGFSALGSGAPWLGVLLEWLFFGGAAVGLAWMLWRSMQRQRLAIALHESTGGLAWEREATDWAADAETNARAGRWRDAVHCLYWAAIVLLEGRRAWRHNPARTPREYVRLLEAGSAQQQSLRGLTQMLERLWYGLREAEEGDYERARMLFEALRGRQEAGAA